jgi:hypothetical protein
LNVPRGAFAADGWIVMMPESLAFAVPDGVIT